MAVFLFSGLLLWIANIPIRKGWGLFGVLSLIGLFELMDLDVPAIRFIRRLRPQKSSEHRTCDAASVRSPAESKPCARLVKAVALIPGPRLRKRVEKMVADEAAHALELQASGRTKAARWIVICAWVYAAFIVFRSPFAAILEVLK